MYLQYSCITMYFMKLHNCIKAEKVYGHCMISLLNILVRFTAAYFLYIYGNVDFYSY